jgi:dolichyl-phosphate-mannose--protein O-mannosyl transferase
MNWPAPGWRRDLALALIFAAIAAAFRLPRLGTPNEEVFDEVYHAKTALQYLKGQPLTEWVHPPTAKLLIAIPVWAFGYTAWAWRLAPALAGIALAPVFFWMARRVSSSERAAVLATTLLLCDGVYLVQSRIAMTNIFAVLFQLGAALFVVRAVTSPSGRLLARDMLPAGMFIGLALATRWTSLWATGFLGLVLVAYAARRLHRRGLATDAERPASLRASECVLVVVAFAFIPGVLYALSYVPWMFIRHPELREAAAGGSLEAWRTLLVDTAEEQGRVWSYHANLNATHPYFSAWYTWPWLVRPTWYYYDGKTAVRGIIALGNPGLWWASVPVTLWALGMGLWRRDPRRLFAGFGFCLLYLPWGLAPRTLNFSHYLFEAIPYACLSLGLLLDGAWDDPAWNLPARFYVAAVAMLFVFVFPMLTAIPIPLEVGLGPWTWFKTWI